MHPQLRFLRGARIYFDANVFIYRVDGEALWQPLFDELWQMLERGDFTVVTSELSLAESLVWPIKSKNRAAQAAFAKMIASGEKLITLPISREILLEAARLRALHHLEMPDAIHGATAKISRCKWFLTNDEPLAAASGAKAILLSELRKNVTNDEVWPQIGS